LTLRALLHVVKQGKKKRKKVLHKARIPVE
jgi:hypothetical protein